MALQYPPCQILNLLPGANFAHVGGDARLMGCRGPADTSVMDTPSKLVPAARPAGAASAEPPAAAHAGSKRVRAGAVIAVALAVAFGAWLVLRDGRSESSGPDAAVSSAASVAQLRDLPDRTGHAVYWAGPLEGHTYELTRPTDGNVYVRYLPRGVAIGDRRPDYTTIGTYPGPGALKGLRRLARQPGARTFQLAGDGMAVYDRNRPSSVYLSFPGQDIQVEVYDPSPRKARRLARSGRVRPVG